jgi:hypothetical protein
MLIYQYFLNSKNVAILFLGTAFTNAFYQQFGFAKKITIGELNGRNMYFFEALDFIAAGTFKMDMFVLVGILRAVLPAEGKAGSAAIVEHLVQDAVRLQRAKNAVQGNAVEMFRQYFFNIGLAEGFFFMVEYGQYIGTLPRKTQSVFL